MSNRVERVYALLVNANPVPDHEPPAKMTAMSRPSLRLVTDGDIGDTPATAPLKPKRRDRWPRSVAAALSLTFFVILFAFALSRPIETEPVAPATPEEDVLWRVEAWFTAIATDQIDDLPTAFGIELTEADRQMWAFNATLARVHPLELQSCEITQSVGSLILAECSVVHSDPVSMATGTAEITYPFRSQDGIVTWQEMRLTTGTGSPFGASIAYAEYLQLFEPDAYARVCSQDSYEGDIIFNGYLALTPSCAELLLEHANDAAAWIDAGSATP